MDHLIDSLHNSEFTPPHYRVSPEERHEQNRKELLPHLPSVGSFSSLDEGSASPILFERAGFEYEVVTVEKEPSVKEEERPTDEQLEQNFKRVFQEASIVVDLANETLTLRNKMLSDYHKRTNQIIDQATQSLMNQENE